MTRAHLKTIASCMLVWFPVFVVMPVFGQDFGSDFNSSTESTSGSSQTSEPPPAPPSDSPPPAPSDSYGAPAIELGSTMPSSSDNPIQNAVIEGVQVSSEPSGKPDEKIISCYFIFRDKPSSYFYEIKLREKKLVFEFNDTRIGAAPVPSVSESPIKGFTVEQRKVDVNKEVRGLKPEWHDLIRVVFDLDAVPDVHVNDEYSIISFSYKWTTKAEKMALYTVKDKTPKVIMWSTGGLAAVGGVVLTYFLLNKPEPPAPPGPIPYDDLPVHPTPQ